MPTRPTKNSQGDDGAQERGGMGRAVSGSARDPEAVQAILEAEGIEPDSPIDDPNEKAGPAGPPGESPG